MKKGMALVFFCVLTASFGACKKEGKDDEMQKELAVALTSNLQVRVDSMLKVEGIYNGYTNRHSETDSILYKLIDYTDVDDCTPCKMEELYGWKELWNKADSMDVPLSFYHIFAIPPSQTGHLIVKARLIAEELEYPIYIDSSGIFRELNTELLSRTRFRTFLINQQGDVLMVGNPRKNWKIAKMLWEKVSKQALSDKDPQE